MITRRKGIYRLECKTFTIVFGPWNGPAPDGFEPAEGRTVEIWTRVGVDDRPVASDPANEGEDFTGSWTLVESLKGVRRVVPPDRQLEVVDARWVEIHQGQRLPWTLRRTPGEPWPIYELDRDVSAFEPQELGEIRIVIEKSRASISWTGTR
jgi:hypothetical protein